MLNLLRTVLVWSPLVLCKTLNLRPVGRPFMSSQPHSMRGKAVAEIPFNSL